MYLNTNTLLKFSFSARQEIEGTRIYTSYNHRNTNEDASQMENCFLKDDIVHDLFLVNVKRSFLYLSIITTTK